MPSVPELSSALSPWRKDVAVNNKESTDEPDNEDFQSTEKIRATLHEECELPSPIMIHEVVSVEPSTVLDEACPVSIAGSHSTDETPTSSGGISKSPTPSRLSGLGKAGETTGEENEENYIGTTTADSTQDPRHIIVTFNGELLPIEVESSKTLFDLRKEILNRRIPEDGNFFFLLGKNVISKKLEKRHLIDDILQNDIPVSLTSRSNLEEAGGKSLPARETIPRMPTKSVLHVEAEQPAAPVETAMQAQANEHDRESCTSLTWDDGLELLNAFKFEFGHVDVPATFYTNKQNQPLRNFVENIRKSYKNIQEGQMNGNKLLSDQRISELELMGFKFQVQVRQIMSWEHRFEELRQHFRTHGNSEVPKDTTLGRWIKTQRYYFKTQSFYFKTKSEGEKSSLGLQRIGLLDSIGFDWRVDTNDEVADQVSMNADQGR